MTTATGPVPASDLGVCSMHEHAQVDASVYADVRRAIVGAAGGPLAGRVRIEQLAHLRNVGYFLSPENLRLDDEEAVTGDLAHFAGLGGRTVLDVSSVGLRGDPRRIAALSRASGVAIVVSTGLYIEPSWPAAYREMDVGELAHWMISELTEGIADTGIRAAHIGEIGVTDLSAAQRRVLEAAAYAAGETGVSVTVHPGFDDATDGRVIARLMRTYGMDLERLVIAHADNFFVEHDLGRLIRDPRAWGLRLDYHRELLEAGVTLSVDCFGHGWNMETAGWMIERDVHRLAGVRALVQLGYADRLVLGTDTFVKTLTRPYGGDGYGRLLNFAAPALRSAGVAEAALDAMLRSNPRRLLTAARVEHR